MYLSLDDMIQEACQLPLIPLNGTTSYHETTPLLINYVNDTMSKNPVIHNLIGNNPLQVMYDNHKNHAALMVTVFSLGHFELLARTVPWVYRAYSGHHFSYDYFPLALKTWLDALDQHGKPDQIREIKTIYNWMLDMHENMIHASQSNVDLQPSFSKDLLDRKNHFLNALLEGDHRKCLNIAESVILNGNDIEPFYLQIIQPAMYEIGMLWERGAISVAQEHLASAIVGRVMASISMLSKASRKVRAKAVITSAPNEFHEIGAWMVSDILEHDGWDVRYLGANTPIADLLALLRSFKPNILALSVTMPFNILKSKEIIDTIKGDAELNTIQIIVGGLAFNENKTLWRTTGADHFAANVHDVKKWVQEKENIWTI